MEQNRYELDNGTATSKQPILRAINISKEFPGVKALSNVDFEVKKGEVVALLGENGAGKSTLIKVLSGVYSCDSGAIELEGKRVKFVLPSDAKEAGIGIIHQELNYVATVSVAENIYMGDIPKKGPIIDYKAMYEGARTILGRIGVDIDSKMPIGACSVAQKQLIEIAKVISHDVKILIMDEPTSALNDVETENLFRFIEQASSEGISIIYISHKLDEIFRVAHRVVVLRDGVVTGEIAVQEADKSTLISMMVGRKIEDLYPKQGAEIGEIALEVKNLVTDWLKGVSFSARKGEIFGIYGLLGSGHQDIGPALFGKDIIHAGEVFINGRKAAIKNPRDALNHGLAYVPSERKTEGLVLNSSVRNNIMAPYYAHNGKRRLINNAFEKSVVQKWIKNLSIKTPSAETSSESLSGGNQQKVVLSKWLEIEPDVLILNEPTRGIDVGSKAEIYKILDDLCRSGKCVIMITSEMPELITMSDRIMVMHDGEISGMVDAKDATQETIVKYAIGG
ncbi:MAG TPA: sugar ABC transporter ATP-binding protein [Feifaniaceae bacterium]|nr:sugar ABC transporter ATP-binding protein [Feifaniaceae bacterium]